MSYTSVRSAVPAFVFLLTMGGCNRAPGPGRVAPEADRVVLDRLVFGRNIPGGGTVSDSAWSVFLADAVTPRLPGGFTVLRGEGQWRGDNGAIGREASFVIEVAHPAGSPPDSTFEAIAREYVRRFRQDAVLRVRYPVEEWLYRVIP